MFVQQGRESKEEFFILKGKERERERERERELIFEKVLLRR